MIAALFVQPKGCYVGLPHVDPWPESRDARTYDGPHPVVAHPPCSRWCKYAPVNERRYGHRVGDDGGCFASALASVRKWGGVLEHPAYSLAWPAFELPRPTKGQWTQASCGGWVCHVDQVAYGHAARKSTWLYASPGARPQDLDWNSPEASAVVGYSTQDGRGRAYETTKKRLSKRAASATPPRFRDALIELAKERAR
jgi:hypothetical protein